MKYQIWGKPNESQFVPVCKACGEQLRSSPIYDGSDGFCIRKRCLKERAEDKKT